MTYRNPLETLPIPPLSRLPFVLNGIDATSGRYLSDGLTWQHVADRATQVQKLCLPQKALRYATRRIPIEDFGPIYGTDPNSLTDMGWAVVFPAVERGSDAERRQSAIFEALTPLLVHRRRQVTSLYGHRYQVYAGTRGYRSGETKLSFLTRLGAGPGSVNPDKVPYYLLLVGSPEEIPYQVQYQLDVQYAVGRIHFETIEDYAHYAQSVVDTETGHVTRPHGAAFFGPAHPGDPATELSCAHLVRPLADGLAELTDVPVQRKLAEDATHAGLAELYQNGPAVLFSASHGVGFPCGDPRQLGYQGALLCQDWTGPDRGPLQREHYFAGEDLDPAVDLRGLIAMHFACYGAGTPREDDFAYDDEPGSASPLAFKNFVARLPQRLLSHIGGGALAAIGHVDRAWSSSFLWGEDQIQGQIHLEAFLSVLKGILHGQRVGFAMEHINLRYAELASDLTVRVEAGRRQSEALDPYELAHLWLFANDARNYAVVGDPAVRLPTASPDVSRRDRTSENHGDPR